MLTKTPAAWLYAGRFEGTVLLRVMLAVVGCNHSRRQEAMCLPHGQRSCLP